MIELDATYDPTKNPFTPNEPGNYPAHIVGLTCRDVKTRSGDAKVINMTYEIAEETKEIEQISYKMDGYNYVLDSKTSKRIKQLDENGNTVMIKCTHLVGKKFRDNGIFVFIGSESSGKNKKYVDLLKTLEKEPSKNENGTYNLSLIEEQDVLGKAVLVNLGSEKYEKDGEEKTAWKVFDINKWEEGKNKSEDEVNSDLPF